MKTDKYKTEESYMDEEERICRMYAMEEDIDDNEDEPDYYYCSCCHHTQVKPGMANGCDNCGLFNVMEAEYF